MTDNRTVGRYNLHRLGSAAFEDFCMQIMRVVLGETCTRFPLGADGGRDGWFRGKAKDLLGVQSGITGDFVIQCKHSSKPHQSLSKSDLTKEVEKVRKIAGASECSYILMTNRQVTANAEQEIRLAFQSLPGVKNCVILSELWLEDTVDAHPRLLRVVPRLYGIGDLSQILSYTIEKQTLALFEDLSQAMRTFVPTDSYRRAEIALNDFRFVVLVGPPASGKSAIAANLCTVSVAQNRDVRVLRIESAEQFKTTWSPGDDRTIYWVDDVFGETTLDDDRLRDWSSALEKVDAARKRGARIVFCTRDYILAAAALRLKRSKADFINDARVRVDVTELHASERDAILYNHIKEGDLDKRQKTLLKRHLAMLARLPSFSPELARRLGSKRFHQSIKYDDASLRGFFDNPVDHFRDVIHGLSRSETAALAVCLLGNNSIPDPIPDESLAPIVLETYGVNRPDVRNAFDVLAGSLLKRSQQGTSQVWQVHHPTMIESLQRELPSKSSQLLLYVKGAKPQALFRDTTTLPTSPESRLVFLPESVYTELVSRFVAIDQPRYNELANYLIERGSDKLLVHINSVAPRLLDAAIRETPYPQEYHEDIAARMAVRLFRIGNETLFTAGRRSDAMNAIENGIEKSGWMGFLRVDGFDEVYPGYVESFLLRQQNDEFPVISALTRWANNDLSSKSIVESSIDSISSQFSALTAALDSRGMLGDELAETLTEMEEESLSELHTHLYEFERQENMQADYEADSWREDAFFERLDVENGRFGDVDE